MASWPFALPRSRHLRWVFPKCNNNLTSLGKIAGGAQTSIANNTSRVCPLASGTLLRRRFPSSLLRRSSVQAALRPFGSLEDLLWVTSF
jgi:hypothetical protein